MFNDITVIICVQWICLMKFGHVLSNHWCSPQCCRYFLSHYERGFHLTDPMMVVAAYMKLDFQMQVANVLWPAFFSHYLCCAIRTIWTLDLVWFKSRGIEWKEWVSRNNFAVCDVSALIPFIGQKLTEQRAKPGLGECVTWRIELFDEYVAVDHWSAEYHMQSYIKPSSQGFIFFFLTTKPFHFSFSLSSSTIMSQRKTVLLALFALVCALFVAAPVAFAADDAESYGAGKFINIKGDDLFFMYRSLITLCSLL